MGVMGTPGQPGSPGPAGVPGLPGDKGNFRKACLMSMSQCLLGNSRMVIDHVSFQEAKERC